jgi:predicted nucleotidyltransferase
MNRVRSGLTDWCILHGIVIYEARKAIRLLQGGNPNVLSLLWLEPNYRIAVTPAGQHLLGHRGLFVGRHVYKPFVG